MKTKRPIKPISITILAVSVVCLCAACFATILGSSYLSRITFFGTRVCAGFTTSPRVQLGIAWVSPLSSYLPSLMMSQAAVCVSLPISPPINLFGINGEWMFPP